MTDTHLIIILDEAITRQCLKYRLNPAPFMMKALQEELHARALAARADQENPYQEIQKLRDQIEALGGNLYD